MPTYDYVCEACEHEFELMQSIKADAIKQCPECGKNKLRRLIGPGAAIVFKGSGFYTTDYRSESYKKAAAADKPADKPSDKAVSRPRLHPAKSPRKNPRKNRAINPRIPAPKRARARKKATPRSSGGPGARAGSFRPIRAWNHLPASCEEASPRKSLIVC